MKGLNLQKRNLRTLLAGIGLILLTNAIVLAGVEYNRSGTPDSSVTLTERELPLPYFYGARKENSGISLHIQFRNKGSNIFGLAYYQQEANWLTEEKLKALGFDVSKTIDEDGDWKNYKRAREREVILVLEYNGDAYQATLNAAQQMVAELQANAPYEKTEDQNKLKQAESNLEQEQNTATRLFLIDAGLDEETLRQQYPDNTKYILLKGLAGMYINRIRNSARTYTGYIKSLSVSNVNIPLGYHKALDAARAEGYRPGQNQPPRYEVKLNIGKRLEPWVVGVEGL